MRLTAEEANPWVMPAMHISCRKLGYEFVRSVDVTMIQAGLPEGKNSVLHYKKQDLKSNILIWLGNMGWDGEGLEACCEYKLFKSWHSDILPSRLRFDNEKTRMLYWAWSEPGIYCHEPMSEALVKAETIHSIILK